MLFKVEITIEGIYGLLEFRQKAIWKPCIERNAELPTEAEKSQKLKY